MDHRRQLITEASVKGSGMAFADLVCKTTFNADSGDPNMMTHKMTPKFPTIGGSAAADMIRHKVTRAETPCMCCKTEPGRVEDLIGEYLMKLRK